MKTRIIAAAAALALLTGACATAPPPAEAPRDEEERATPTPEAPVRGDPALRIGVVLTTSGSGAMRQYGDAVLDGVRVGATAAGREIELIVEDDGGTAAGAASAVRRLQDAGVRAVVGPLTDAALAAAAAARTDRRMVLVSPMAIADPVGPVGIYALNVVDARGAAALGRYAHRFQRVGVMHSRTPDGERQAQAFIDAYDAGGGTVTRVSFQSGASNLATELSRLRTARVQAIYAPGTERELQIVLPQIEYFGLTDVQILGNDSYIGDAARGLPQRLLQGAIVATSLIRESSEFAWNDFVAAYEARYRRSLASPVPALGYDAVLLAARLADGTGEVTDLRGATGVITVRNDAVTRRPFLVRIDAGRLIPVN